MQGPFEFGGEGGITRAYALALRVAVAARRRSSPPPAARRTQLFWIPRVRIRPGPKHQKAPCRGLLNLAEREGFEPSVRYSRTHTFQACSFDRSDTSPGRFRSALAWRCEDEARKRKPGANVAQQRHATDHRWWLTGARGTCSIRPRKTSPRMWIRCSWSPDSKYTSSWCARMGSMTTSTP